jgi:four helix bundle protein
MSSLSVTAALVPLPSPLSVSGREAKAVGASYRDLRVWRLAMELVVGVYAQTRCFPKEEVYGLTSPMRRSSVSVPSNIAEGKGRSTDRDRAVFFCHARGSLLELETQILIAQQLKYLAPSGAEKLIASSAQLGRMLNALIQSLRNPENSGKISSVNSDTPRPSKV